MIVSYEKNFIFIKTRKTGGTSVEIALTPSCGPDDILSLITLEDEHLRLQDGRVAARNYVGDRGLETRIERAILKRKPGRFRKLRKQAIGQGALTNHSSASKIRNAIPREFWDKAFKFTIERHPYEKVVSGVYWGSRHQTEKNMVELLDEKVAIRPEDLRLYSIDGEVVVDEILRQETLAEDLMRISDRLGLDLPATLPNAKGAHRADRRSAHDILSPAQKKVIYERHRRTFDLLGYQP
ncbi:MAG: hypothetical protein KDJ86_09185 [Bauldia sp.]|uniref:hypothetical protein n=1 Tax=Bauldia sp. TaxID=2575872 RepID=UPI001DF6E6CC|nr:hypothetical protein [Bauldia sp.]MCB1495945.1 hypothetical protein [Bauldia sp.]